ncbi:orotidine-5'-phosphate decarboxylase [Trueperella sp. LYQ143]|uniref:orotidine-5'-phosphate decarboxylase n=1 Tax=unclassified Trueperella TaxID=2630174 RepID=UPI003983A7E1
MTYGERQYEAIKRFGGVCAGIDPHASLLRDWELNDDVASVREFSLRVVEALAGYVAAFKPQSAFFERFGSRGIAVLEEVLDAIRSYDSLAVLDVKRGDIGSTMAGYADAYLSPSAPLRADAITVSPYLGYSSLEATIRYAYQHDRGVFVLGLTSNKEADEIQHVGQPAVARRVFDYVCQANEAAACTPGSVGLVVGATIGDGAQRAGIELASFNGIYLAPGVGAQGAGERELQELFADVPTLASASRSILAAGPRADDLRSAARALAQWNNRS